MILKDFFSEQFKKYWLYSTIVLFLIGILFGPAGEKQSSAAMAIGALIGAGLGSAILGFIIAAIINVFTDKKIQGINPLEKDSTEKSEPQEENYSEENIEPLIQEEETKKSPERERSTKLYEKFLSETITLDNAENREQLKDEFKNWLKERNR